MRHCWKAAALMLIVFMTGCTSCGMTVYSEDVYHNTEMRELDVTTGVRCGDLEPGAVYYELFENRTGTVLLNGTIPFQGATGPQDDYDYFNITIDVSSIQLNPYWYYIVRLDFPPDVYISTSFYAEDPIPEDRCALKPMVGHCSGNYTTYYYDESTGRCEESTVGFCGVEPYERFNDCSGYCGLRDCDETNPCPEGIGCYKFEDREFEICWEGNPCDRCFSAECELDGDVVNCV